MQIAPEVTATGRRCRGDRPGGGRAWGADELGGALAEHGPVRAGDVSATSRGRRCGSRARRVGACRIRHRFRERTPHVWHITGARIQRVDRKDACSGLSTARCGCRQVGEVRLRSTAAATTATSGRTSPARQAHAQPARRPIRLHPRLPPPGRSPRHRRPWPLLLVRSAWMLSCPTPRLTAPAWFDFSGRAPRWRRLPPRAGPLCR